MIENRHPLSVDIANHPNILAGSPLDAHAHYSETTEGLNMSGSPTHAGAVVFRTQDDGPRFLIVASSDARCWVLPKGHIEPGESPEQAAGRELAEEAGVTGEILSPLTLQQFEKDTETVRVQYFLVRETGSTAAQEERETAWLTSDGAVSRLSFPDAREALRLAADAVSEPMRAR